MVSVARVAEIPNAPHPRRGDGSIEEWISSPAASERSKLSLPIGRELGKDLGRGVTVQLLQTMRRKVRGEAEEKDREGSKSD